MFCQGPTKKARTALRELVDEQRELDTRVHVDFGSKLQVCPTFYVVVTVPMRCSGQGITFASLPSDCQPDGELVNDLASQVAKKVQSGVKTPFVYVVRWCSLVVFSIVLAVCCLMQELAKWMPAWCQDLCGTAEDSSDEEEAGEKKKKKVFSFHSLVLLLCKCV